MIDFYKFLKCTPETLNEDDIKTLKMYEEIESYPPRIKLLFAPNGPQSEQSEAKLYLNGLNNVSPIIIRLGKEKPGMYVFHNHKNINGVHNLCPCLFKMNMMFTKTIPHR